MKTMPLFFGALTIACLLYGNSVAQAALSPTETVKDTVVKVLSILSAAMAWCMDDPTVSHEKSPTGLNH
jgi:hypothetical protein